MKWWSGFTMSSLFPVHIFLLMAPKEKTVSFEMQFDTLVKLMWFYFCIFFSVINCRTVTFSKWFLQIEMLISKCGEEQVSLWNSGGFFTVYQEATFLGICSPVILQDLFFLLFINWTAGSLGEDWFWAVTSWPGAQGTSGRCWDTGSGADVVKGLGLRTGQGELVLLLPWLRQAI